MQNVLLLIYYNKIFIYNQQHQHQEDIMLVDLVRKEIILLEDIKVVVHQ